MRMHAMLSLLAGVCFIAPALLGPGTALADVHAAPNPAPSPEPSAAKLAAVSAVDR